MKGKHSKKTEKSFKSVYLLIILLVVLILGYKYFYKDRLEEIIPNVDVENEKLVIKSNFEENREKKIIYFFDEKILLEVRVLENYINEQEYNIQKDNYSKMANIEIIELNDSEFKIYYKRLNLGTDEGLSYQEIYDKYMGIIGAYEVINE